MCGRQERRSGGELCTREPASILELAADLDLCAGLGLRVEAEHQGGGKRPGLRGVIVDTLHTHTRLLANLAHDRVLEALTRFDKTGDRRVATRWPGGLTAEQRTFPVGDQHDDGRVDARECLVPALR